MAGISTRSKLVFLISCLVLLILGGNIYNWHQARKGQKALNVLLEMGDIDMTMNEDIIEPLEHLYSHVLEYAIKRDKKIVGEILQHQKDIAGNVENWARMISETGKFGTAGTELVKRYKTIELEIGRLLELSDYEKLKLKTEDYDRNIHHIISLLEKLMEEVVDPSKAKAEKNLQVCLQSGASCVSQFAVLKKWSSLDMDMNDRKILANIIMESKDSKFLVVHGTDTMDITAEFLSAVFDDRVIVLTGAMKPFEIDNIEASVNFGMAYGFLQGCDKNGVYICMSGHVKEWEDLKKNKQLGKFEVVK
jgi:L-asparaginase